MRLEPAFTQRIANDGALWRDFEAICDSGGRLAGTESERRAVELVARLGSEAAGGVPGRFLPVPYEGWKATRAELRLADGAQQSCHIPWCVRPQRPKAG